MRRAVSLPPDRPPPASPPPGRRAPPSTASQNSGRGWNNGPTSSATSALPGGRAFGLKARGGGTTSRTRIGALVGLDNSYRRPHSGPQQRDVSSAPVPARALAQTPRSGTPTTCRAGASGRVRGAGSGAVGRGRRLPQPAPPTPARQAKLSPTSFHPMTTPSAWGALWAISLLERAPASSAQRLAGDRSVSGRGRRTAPHERLGAFEPGTAVAT
jgi:hypothetical protein